MSEIASTVRPLEEQAREFYHAMGRAISDWAHIEKELFDICCSIINADVLHTAIVFYRTPSLDARISLASDLVATVIPKDKSLMTADHKLLGDLWKASVSVLRDELGTRNQLAHSPVALAVDLDPHADRVKIRDIAWASFISEGDKLRGKKERELKIADIEAHAANMMDALRGLSAFRDALKVVLGYNIAKVGGTVAPAMET